MTAITDRVQPAGRGLVVERPVRRASCLGTKTSRRPTLDDLLVGAWEDLRAAQAADCPVCGGTMLSRRGAGPAGRAAGACEDCGSELS